MKMNNLCDFFYSSSVKMSKTTNILLRFRFLHHLMKLVALMGFLIIAGNLWGQSEGVYYIDNYKNHTQAVNNRYYLIPADDPHQTDKNDAFFSSNTPYDGDPERPFLTTYKTNKDQAAVPSGVVNNLPNNSVWILKAVSGENGFFYIIHASSGKYVVYEPPYSSRPNRKSMHLLATNSPGENAKFQITPDGDGYCIRPKSVSVTTDNKYFNPAGTAWDYYYGKGGSNDPAYNYIGLVGLYKIDNDRTSIWYTESTLLTAPTISSVIPSTSCVTVTDNNGLLGDYDILYTFSTSGTPADPTAASNIMENRTFQVTDHGYLKAVVARYGVVLTTVAGPVELTPTIITPPTISFNNSTQQISITHPSNDATLYYTIDGTDPTTTNYAGTGSSPLSFSPTNPCTVKAIAVRYGISSEPVPFNLEKSTTPTITLDATNPQVSISADEGATIYYTTDPNAEPNVPYSGPISVSSGQIIRARAVEENKIPSDIAGMLVIYPSLPTPPTITYDNVTQRITISHNYTPAEDYTIRWTTADGLPIDQWTIYSEPVSPNTPVQPCTVKAIVVENATDYTSGIATLELQQVETPTATMVDNHIVLSCATTGVTIYFTTNNSAPTTQSIQYSSPLNVNYAGLPLRFIAMKSGTINSAIGNATFHQVATPVIADNGANQIAITCATSDAAIYYTTDGSTPTTASTPYTEPLGSSYSGQTIKAIAVKTDMFNSDIAENQITLQCPTPIITINEETGEVGIACGFDGAAIYYTTNGTNPNPQQVGGAWPTQLYNANNPFLLTQAATVKAIATKTNCTNSSIASQTFEQAPEPEMVFTNQLIITAGDATVKYRLSDSDPYQLYDNSNPLTSSTQGINWGSTMLQVKSVKAGYVPYIVTPFPLDKTADPSIAEDGNNAYAITSTTPGASIKFTVGESTTWVDYTAPLGRDSYNGAYWDALTSGDVQISAYASKENMFQSQTNSIVGAHLYALVPQVTINSAGQVVITLPEGTPANYATIHYTTTGYMPNANSPTYTESFMLSVGAIVQAVGVRGTYVSAVSNSESIAQVMDPVIMDNGDNHISITTAELGATIYYTTDGSDPDVTFNIGSNSYTVGEHTLLYNPSQPLDYTHSGQTIKAVAVKPGMVNSQVVTGSITLRYIEPGISIDPAIGAVTLTGLDEQGELFFYTTTGTDPVVTYENGNFVAGTATSGYTDPFSIYNPSASYNANGTTVKAVAAREGWNVSSPANKVFYQVHLPEVAPTGSNQIEMTCETEGASIFYTTDGSNPVVTYVGTNFVAGANTSHYTDVLSSTYSGTNFKVVAVKAGMIPSPVKDAPAPHTQCKKPLINRYGDQMVITRGSYPPSDVTVTIYYTVTTNTTELPPDPITVNANGTYTVHGDAQVFTSNINLLSTYFTNQNDNFEYINVKAAVVATGYRPSDISSKKIVESLQTEGSGTDLVYLITQDGDLDMFVHMVNHDGPGYHYKLTANVSAAGIDEIDDNDFSGILEGSANADGVYYTISDLSHPLFNTVDGGTVRNIMMKNVSISQSGSVGAVCGEAKGAARIYNCGILPTDPLNTEPSTIASTYGYCGSLVGKLDGTARVINCFSYANITDGKVKGGIVGYNGFSSSAAASNNTYPDLRTMVMNCMYFGSISSGGTVSPIYGGEIINNAGGNGINNFNFFRYVEGTTLTSSDVTYNCALAATDRFLTHYEFFRYMLNSNCALAAFYVDPSPTTLTVNGNVHARYHTELIAKWVLDKSVAPYLVLKEPSTEAHRHIYPSVVNYNPNKRVNPETGALENRPDANASNYQRNQGGIFGTLSVTINDPEGSGKPEGATLNTTSLTLNIIDKDTAEFNYNYYKVQLPYYNQVGTGNYTKNKVVTGWKITSILGGTPGTFKEGDDEESYNFADRFCTNKDLYSSSDPNVTVGGRVFSQGAYFDVPDGVNAIVIEPYWAKAVYLSDPRYDVVYTTDYGKQDFNPAGKRYTNGSLFSINGDNQAVYTSLTGEQGAVAKLFENETTTGKTVYDYAIVLVGNYHSFNQSNGSNAGFTGDNTQPLTVMSIDLDFDNDPDYSFIYHHHRRRKYSQLRFDFVNIPGFYLVQKVNGSGNKKPCPGIFHPQGWFEVTNTGLIEIEQIEYGDNKQITSPLILLGGLYDQIVSNQATWNNNNTLTNYIHVGGNAWFAAFNNGCHGSKNYNTKHCPISVTGGDFDRFYLSGYYPERTDGIQDNHAECYVNGGRFGEMASAAIESLNGNAIWKIDHADIDAFFGGGYNPQKKLMGNIDVSIDNSYVKLYCAGPKFGDMESGKTVNTNATGSIFGEFYGAGYGGTAISSIKAWGDADPTNPDEAAWQGYVDTHYHRQYESGKGTAVGHTYEYFFTSGGNDNSLTARFYINYANMSLATTNNVTSVLTNCTVMQDYYGGGHLGKVAGNATSTLNSCTIHGNVFGGGFSSVFESVEVLPKEHYVTPPDYDDRLGIFIPAKYPASVTYTWKHADQVSQGNEFDEEGGHFILTTVDLTTLGTVSGHTTVTVTGNTYVEGMIDGEPVGGVFGGGDEAYVGSSEVHIQTDEDEDAHPINNVYGGGNEAITLGDAEVTIHTGLIGQIGSDGKVVSGTGNVFGGGRGRLPMGNETLQDAIDFGRVEGNTTVNINGGHIRYNVYGGGKMASVGTVDGQYNITSGGATQVNVIGGEVGPLDMSGLNAYVYGGGMGVEVDYSNTYKHFADVGNTTVTMQGGRVWGSLFGGGADGHVLGNAAVNLSGGILGTWGKTSWDGNIFGGGRNYRYTNYAAGRVQGNITVNMSGGKMMGSVFGGGRLGNTGVDEDGAMIADEGEETHGHIFVNITGGTVGNDSIAVPTYIYGTTTIPHEAYLEYIGHVFGGAKGKIGELNLGQVKETHVTISGANTWVLGSVYGGAELGAVRGAANENGKGNTEVNINGGTIGTLAYTKNAGDAKWTAYYHVNGGKVFGGGKGTTDFVYGGLVYQNTEVNINGGHVLYGVYGGGELASVGSSGNLQTGLATVTVTGGQVGPAPKVEGDYNIPIGLNGVDGYVFGGGQGIGDDPITTDYPAGQYYNLANVNTTLVTVNMPMENNIPTDTVNNRIWGSIFGGGEDGHVLSDAEVRFKGGLMGTFGTTSYDGNIFGGGRNYDKKNYTAGRVGGNITVEMTGGIMYGSIFGAGRLGLTGVDATGTPVPDADRGLVTVKVKGGTVGNAKKISNFTTYSMGDVYGGGKGSMEGIAGHDPASALLISICKNTIVEISEENPAIPTRILGSVYGGGEVANVGYFNWGIVDGAIGNIQLISDGLAKVTVTGGIIGVDRMQMRYDLKEGTYDLLYNDDVGHVFGGGEGYAHDPDSYATVNPGTLGGHNNRSLLDLMATVHSTEVTIGGTAWVKGSVYGGAENGHVMGDTYVKIAGGQIGAGDNGVADVRYTNEQFFDPTGQLVNNSNKLFECVSWDYNPTNYHPFDPILVANGNTPTDGKTWFGNVFGGGSGYYPYIKDGATHWNRASGQVEGNSRVEITGGHILTSVYGGGETNDVGIKNHTTGQYISNGNATVTMSGGTLGVPRTYEQIQAHPVTCYLFGSGKGDERIYFNTWTNVNNVNVDITGGIIYGSAFGGGEEGHVINDVTLNVSDNAIIGTIGYSNVDGNIFGGGRGFNAEALTAGTVGGNIDVNITGGTMLGSIYGGGRNGSVGTHLVDKFIENEQGQTILNPVYGTMQHDDETKTHGHIAVNISGGTIGNPYETIEEPIGGNVFGGCMGLATSSLWNQIARAKQTEVNITGNPIIKGSVFGGSKEGSIVMDVFTDTNGNEHSDGGNTHVVVSGGTIGWMPQERVHVGGDVYGGGRGYDSNDANAADKRLSGIVERNTTVDISGGQILYNIYGGGEMASVGLTTDVTTNDKIYHVPVAGTGIATVNFSGGELGPRPNADGTDGLNSLDGYLFGGGKGVVHEGLTEEQYLDRYKWFGDVNKTVVTMSGGRIWGSLFGGAEDGHVLDDVYISFTDGTIGTHGITGYDGNIFSGGRNYSDFHTSTGRVGSNIVTRMTGTNCYLLGSMFGGGRQGSVGVDEYGVMKMDDAPHVYGCTNVAITDGVVGHDHHHGDPLIGGQVYGGSKGKAGKPEQGLVKDATVVVTGNAEVKGSVFGGGENAHIMGMTHVTVGDATVDNGVFVGSGVVIGTQGLPGEDGNVYGGGRGDGTYTDNNNVTHYSPTAGFVGTSTNLVINNGTILGSVYGGGRFASVGDTAVLVYYDVNNPFQPTDFGRTNVTVSGSAVIGSKIYDNGHVFGGGRGNSHPDFDNFTKVHETFVHITGNAQVNGSVFGGAEDGHVANYTTTNTQLQTIASAKNGDTHVFVSGSANIGDASSQNNETRGNVYGGGRGLDQYKDASGNMVWNPKAGRVEGNSHATLFNGTVYRFMFGGGNHSVVAGRKVVNIEDGTVRRDVYGGSKLLDDTWSHPGLKTVNIHGGTVHNVFGCGYNLNDGDPHLYYYDGNNRYQAYKRDGSWYYKDGDGEEHSVSMEELQFSDAPTSFVNISGGHIVENVHAAGQAGTVYGSTLVNIGKNAIYNAPKHDDNIDQDDLNTEKVFFNTVTGTGTNPSGEAHQVSRLLVDASVYGGSSYFDIIGGNVNWNNYTTKGYSNIYVDGTDYSMTALPEGWTYATLPATSMVIRGNFFGSGTHCESGEQGRNIIVRNYGDRITSTETGQEGWFTGSTRPMGTIQRVNNLVIDHSNFTFTGCPALGSNATDIYSVYKVDDCFYVVNASGITLGQGDRVADMDMIHKMCSWHLVNEQNANGPTVYDQLDPSQLTWEWIGIREMNQQANKLYWVSSSDANQLNYPQENVLVFNKLSKLKVRYLDGATLKYGELSGFFRMIADDYSPWGTTSFAYARPKLTHNTMDEDGLKDTNGNYLYSISNTSDGGFMSYTKKYNFYIMNKNIQGQNTSGDGGNDHTKTSQYPYTNVMDDVSAKDNEDVDLHYRLWVRAEFKGNRWYVDGTNGIDDMDPYRGLYPNKPKKTLTGVNGVYAGTKDNDNNDIAFRWEEEWVIENGQEERKDKDVVYVVKPVLTLNEKSENGTVNLNPHPEKGLLRVFRYPGAHTLYEGNNTSYNADPGANADALLNVNTPSTVNVVVDEMLFDGLYGHIGLDNTYMTISPDYDAKADKPLFLTNSGSKLTIKGGTNLQRGYNRTSGANYMTNANFGYSGETQVPVTTPYGGALFVHNEAEVCVEGAPIILGNFQETGTNTYQPCNIFLPSFDKYMIISNPLSSARLGVTSPVRNNEATFRTNTLSPVARGNRSGSAQVGETTVENAVLDAQNAWQDNVFIDDMNCFFGNGTNEQYGNHTTYYKTSIPNYLGSFPVDRTLFFGWTWNNVVRSKPAGYVKSGSTITISSKEGLAWLISRVNGLNNETKCSMADSLILLDTDVENLDKYVWVPVGSTSMSDDIETEQFAGTFDGQGHLIQGLSIAFIGLGDGRYQFADYGMFGRTKGATIDRTFLVDELIAPNSSGNMGGIAGVMQGTGGLISNSEAAVTIEAPTQASANGCGGLAGLLLDGEIHSSMAIADIKASVGYLGGLVGGAYDPELGTHSDVKVNNSFANAKFNVGSILNESVEVGGVVGRNQLASLSNCYSRLLSGGILPNNHFGTVTAYNSQSVAYCYGQEGNYDLNHQTASGGSEVGCGSYTPVIGADNLGYLYYDNVVTMNDKKEALFKKLNRWVDRNSGSGYAYWARPTLGEINDDYPVLLLCDNDGTSVHQGNFRSVGTYAGGRALQYGGPVRDGVGNELDGALTRPLEQDENGVNLADYLFIYGDVNSVGSFLDIKPSKVSIYEHAAILNPGVLGATVSSKDAFNEVYVGVSFDNSSSKAWSTAGMNHLGMQFLPRDWHMFSTPLSNAPLGFDYIVDGFNTNTASYSGGDYGDYYNNGWPYIHNQTDENLEFKWLNGGTTGDNRYWMKTFDASVQNTDGYFPTGVDGSAIRGNNDDLFIVGADECPESGRYRYPYGMDFYCWYEHEPHWINFKRNGPNHWHSDETPNTNNLHEHLAYTENGVSNQNEDNLVVGKGYMMAIHDTTFLQSHGRLNGGELPRAVTIGGVTKNGDTQFGGLNLVGNPYHGYLDFDALAQANSTILDVHEVPQSQQKDGVVTNQPYYVIYDADGYSQLPTGGEDPSSAFRFYVATGSTGGEYADRYLHPHQGFFIKALSAGSLTFTQAMVKTRAAVVENGGSHFRNGWDVEERPAYPLVNLYLSSNNGCADVSVIEFNRPEWGGATKMKQLCQGNGLLYARHNESDYAALFVEKGANRVPLCFDAMEDDTFTIQWNIANGEFSSMYLVDNIAGTQTDMLTTDSYVFDGRKHDYKWRFYIVFSLVEEEPDPEDESDFFVFFDGSQWVVMGEGDLDFIDVLGHVLLHTHLSDGMTRMNLPNVACGVYMMRLTNGKDTKLQKIIIQP